MRYDENYYITRVSFIKEKMKEVFCDLITLNNEITNFSKRGYFNLTFQYLPLEYTIIFENHGRNLSVEIRDTEGAHTWLNQATPYNSCIDDLEDIMITIKKISEVLEKNNFTLYFSKGKKYYKKTPQGVFRVKDI